MREWSRNVGMFINIAHWMYRLMHVFTCIMYLSCKLRLGKRTGKKKYVTLFPKCAQQVGENLQSQCAYPAASNVD